MIMGYNRHKPAPMSCRALILVCNSVRVRHHYNQTSSFFREGVSDFKPCGQYTIAFRFRRSTCSCKLAQFYVCTCFNPTKMSLILTSSLETLQTTLAFCTTPPSAPHAAMLRSRHLRAAKSGDSSFINKSSRQLLLSQTPSYVYRFLRDWLSYFQEHHLLSSI